MRAMEAVHGGVWPADEGELPHAAPLWRRVVASVVDGAVALATAVPAAGIVAYILQYSYVILTSGEGGIPEMAFAFALPVAEAVPAIVIVVLLVRGHLGKTSHRTPGQVAAGIKAVRQEGVVSVHLDNPPGGPPRSLLAQSGSALLAVLVALFTAAVLYLPVTAVLNLIVGDTVDTAHEARVETIAAESDATRDAFCRAVIGGREDTARRMVSDSAGAALTDFLAGARVLGVVAYRPESAEQSYGDGEGHASYNLWEYALAEDGTLTRRLVRVEVDLGLASGVENADKWMVTSLVRSTSAEPVEELPAENVQVQ